MDHWTRIEAAIARVLERLDVVVDPRDQAVAHHMLTVGFWEWWITRAMADCMRPGTVCVDVGANGGYFAALCVGLGASEVVAIEPHPQLAARLRATARRNGWQQMRVIESAVGDTAGRANLFVQGDDNLGGSTLIADKNERTIDVPVQTLDALLGDLAPVADYAWMAPAAARAPGRSAATSSTPRRRCASAATAATGRARAPVRAAVHAVHLQVGPGPAGAARRLARARPRARAADPRRPEERVVAGCGRARAPAPRAPLHSAASVRNNPGSMWTVCCWCRRIRHAGTATKVSCAPSASG